MSVGCGDNSTHPWLTIGLLILLCAGGCGGCTTNKNAKIDPPPTQVERGSLVGQLRAPDELRQAYNPPSTDEYLRLTDTLADFYWDLLSGPIDLNTYRPKFRRVGLRLQRVERHGQEWVVLFEGGKQWRGTGVYVFRTGGDPREIILQAPHSYYDLHTGDITEALFESTQVRGFFFNSLHRYRGASRRSGGHQTHPSDLSHDTTSYFQAILTEYLKQRPKALVVQFHGFDRKDLRKEDIGIVLSDGSTSPDRHVLALEESLEGMLDDWTVAVYPDETDAYGATANAQGKWIRRFDHGRFVHVELIRDIRESMREGGPELRALGMSIVGAIE